MKRDHPENGVEDAGEPTKHFKPDSLPADDALRPYIDSFDEIQKALQKLDEECAREQMTIQKSFDEKKKPWFDKRQAIIEKVPGFWCQTFQNHPALTYMSDEDVALLEHLKRVDLDDNLDDNGSYKIAFVFHEKAGDFFEPLTLVKHVKFENNEEIVVECTEISWKEGKSPIEAAAQRRAANAACEDWSIFEWFTRKTWDDKPDLGEVIRREIWHGPLAYYMSYGQEDEDFEDENDVGAYGDEEDGDEADGDAEGNEDGNGE